MTQYTDSSALNGNSYTSNYFYNASSSSSGSASSNGSISYSGSVTATSQASIEGTISSNGNGYFTITSSSGVSTTYLVLGSTADGKNLIFEANQSQGSNSGPYYILSSTGAAPAGLLSYASTNPYSAPPAACFVAGTLISTTQGEIAVESLEVGSVALTASGEHVPIVWIGHQRVRCERAFNTATVLPVKISADSIAPGRPNRDLLVSPGHAIWFPFMEQGVLIPAGSLINGATITQEHVVEVEYWHIELERHDIILANGQPAESYIDVDNRSFFDNADSYRVPDALTRTLEDYCCPFVAAGPIVEAVRTVLWNRAIALGWTHRVDETPKMHLLVDGERVEPAYAGSRARFIFPADAQEVWLHTPSAVPHHVLNTADARQLGVMIAGLAVMDGLDVCCSISPADDRLCVGFHEIEQGGERRWTSGRSRLPCELWKDCKDVVMLNIDWTDVLPRWQHIAAADNVLPANVSPTIVMAC